MLFELPGLREITGPSKKIMDDWSNMFARDPRSNTAPFETTDEGQADCSYGPANTCGLRRQRRAARRGRPHVRIVS